MGKISTIKINRWDAGIQSSDDAPIEGGATMIKNFDINLDPLRLTPMPAWEAWSSTDEAPMGIKAISSNDNITMYGVGRRPIGAPRNDLQYRFKISATADYSNSNRGWIPIKADGFPSEFWTNAQSDFGDVRVTTSDGETTIAADVSQLDGTTQTGWLIVDGYSEDYYVYYGASSTLSQPTTSAGDPLYYDVYENESVFLPFYRESLRNYGAVGTDIDFDQLGNYTDYESVGTIFEKGATTPSGANVMREQSGSTITHFNSNDVGIMALIEYHGDDIAIDGSVTTFYLRVTSDTPTFFCKLSGTDFTVTGSVNLTPGGVYLLAGWTDVANDIAYLQIFDDNNTLVSVDTNSQTGSIDWGGTPTVADMAIGSSIADFLIYSNDSFGDNDASGLADMLFTNAFSYGVQELLDTTSYSWNGMMLYQRPVSGGTWFPAAEPDPADENYVMRQTFLENVNNDWSWLSTTNDIELSGNTALIYLSQKPVASDFISAQEGLLDSGAASDDNEGPVAIYGPDKDEYMSVGGSAVGNWDGTTVTDSAFAAFSKVASLSTFGQYAVISSNFKNGSYAQLWDYDSTTADEFMTLNSGEVRASGVVGGRPFFVIMNGIDDEQASGQRSLDIMQYTGSPYGQLTHRIKVPSTYDIATNRAYDKPVSQITGKYRDALVFYAKLPADATASTFNEGLWSVGVNEFTGQINLSLLKETGSINWVQNLFTIGQQIYAICDAFVGFNRVDTMIYRLGSSYTDTSSFETVYFDAGDKELLKKLKTVEIAFEELDGNQTITVYYRTDRDGAWVELCNESNAGETKRLCTRTESTDEQMPSFKEIQFKIESVGGSAAIKQFSFDFEDLQQG